MKSATSGSAVNFKPSKLVLRVTEVEISELSTNTNILCEIFQQKETIAAETDVFF